MRSCSMLKTGLCICEMIMGVLLFQPTQAQDRQIGEGISNQIVCLAIGAPNKYAGTANNVYVSPKDGNDWKSINNGFINTSVRTLQIFNDVTPTLVAGTADGIFVTQNDGTSWEERTKGLTNKDVWSLAISKGSLFAGTSNGEVFLSTHRGASWSSISNGLPGDAVVYSLSESGGDLYAGTQKGVFVSKDNGISWSQR